MAGLWYIGEDLDMANNSDEEVKGFRWLQKAAAKGHTKAEYMVGGCYHCGCGVEENRVDAVAWYRKAANKGYEPAFSALDLMGEWEEDED
jgi:TPR repeat protein